MAVSENPKWAKGKSSGKLRTLTDEESQKLLDNYRDNVNSPAHYSNSKIECITYLEDTLGDGITYYLEGNIKKYLHRWRYKNGTEDLKKAQWYLNKLIEIEGKKK